MRAGGMSDSSKWKKQKRSPRHPRHTTKVTPGSELPTPNGATLPSNLTGECPGSLLIKTHREDPFFIRDLKWRAG